LRPPEGVSFLAYVLLEKALCGFRSPVRSLLTSGDIGLMSCWFKLSAVFQGYSVFGGAICSYTGLAAAYVGRSGAFRATMLYGLAHRAIDGIRQGMT
jgi:hypothetical protein